MNTSALILMLTIWLVVIFLTGYFFSKILLSDKKAKNNVKE